jgi:hypothetical protein
MTPPRVRAPDGVPSRRLAGRIRTRSARYRGIAVIIGLGLLWRFCVCGVLPAWAQAGQAKGEPPRPALQIGSAGRFNEDWSVLPGWALSQTDDFWDPFKFIPLTKDGSVWLTLGGQARERLEYYNQFQFGASEPEASDVYLLSRFRPSADLHVLHSSTAALPQLTRVSVSVDLIRSWTEKHGMSRQRQGRCADTCRRSSSPPHLSWVFKATVDLPSFMEALDALRLLWYSAGLLPGRDANCRRFRLPLSQTAQERGSIA